MPLLAGTSNACAQPYAVLPTNGLPSRLACQCGLAGSASTARRPSDPGGRMESTEPAEAPKTWTPDDEGTPPPSAVLAADASSTVSSPVGSDDRHTVAPGAGTTVKVAARPSADCTRDALLP